MVAKKKTEKQLEKERIAAQKRKHDTIQKAQKLLSKEDIVIGDTIYVNGLTATFK